MAPSSAPRAPLPSALQRNHAAVEFVRTLCTLAGGAGAGVLGLTGGAGFLAYLGVQASATLGLAARMGWAPGEYLPGATLAGFAAGSVGESILVYIVAWAVVYSLVHA